MIREKTPTSGTADRVASTEAPAIKPSILNSITSLLSPDAPNKSKKMSMQEPIRDGNGILLFISPLSSVYDVEELNEFARDTHNKLLKLGIGDQSAPQPILTLAKEWSPEKGGMTYAEIIFGSELLGTQITTTDVRISDRFFPEKTKSVKKEMLREFTKIVICPSEAVARFALMTASGKLKDVPKNLQPSTDLKYGITEEQIKLLELTGR